VDRKSLYEAAKKLSETRHNIGPDLSGQSIALYNSLLAEPKRLYAKRADIQGLLPWEPRRNIDLYQAEFEDSVSHLKSALELAAVRPSAKSQHTLSLSPFGVPDLRAFRAEIAEMGESDLVSCVFMDLDNFKAVNDTHNHDVGDGVIRTALYAIYFDTAPFPR